MGARPAGVGGFGLVGGGQGLQELQPEHILEDVVGHLNLDQIHARLEEACFHGGKTGSNLVSYTSKQRT